MSVFCAQWVIFITVFTLKIKLTITMTPVSNVAMWLVTILGWVLHWEECSSTYLYKWPCALTGAGNMGVWTCWFIWTWLIDDLENWWYLELVCSGTGHLVLHLWLSCFRSSCSRTSTRASGRRGFWIGHGEHPSNFVPPGQSRARQCLQPEEDSFDAHVMRYVAVSFFKPTHTHSEVFSTMWLCIAWLKVDYSLQGLNVTWYPAQSPSKQLYHIWAIEGSVKDPHQFSFHFQTRTADAKFTVLRNWRWSFKRLLMIGPGGNDDMEKGKNNYKK